MNKKETSLAIVGATVWPGSGPDTLADHTILIEDGRIAAVGPRETIEVSPGVKVIDAAGLTVIPGLTDAHVHLTTNSNENKVEDNTAYLSNTPGSYMQLHGLRNAMRALTAGFTTLRVMGLRYAGETALRDFIDEGLIFGPNMYVAPWWISMTNGHGDLFYPGNRRRDKWDTADGPDACRQLVRRQGREGADFFKVMSSGGTMSHGDDPHSPNYTVAEIAAIVDEARSMGKKVAAHAHSVEGARRALEAGVHSIEHGTFLGADEFDIMREQGTFLVPTLAISDWLAKDGENRGAGTGNMDKIRRTVDTQRASVRAAFEAGVRIVMGTDSSGDLCPFGEHAREIEIYVELGMKPHQALETATMAAAELFDRVGDMGVVAPGAVADLVVLNKNPLEDVTVLRQAGTIRHLIKDGEDLSVLLGNDDVTSLLRVPRMSVSN